MLDDLRELYQEIILDHGKRPRNHHALPDADRSAEGFNPLCGDRLTVYLRTRDQTISEAAFEGSGCAICTASASLMTEELGGKSFAAARGLFEDFKHLVTDAQTTIDPARLGSLAALGGVRHYPMRVKCATLPWHTMKAALESQPKVVSTE